MRLCLDLAQALACFQEKWEPVFRPEARQDNNLGSDFDSIKVDKTLAPEVEVKGNGVAVMSVFEERRSKDQDEARRFNTELLTAMAFNLAAWLVVGYIAWRIIF